EVGRAVCGAAVKADGYGLGAIHVGPALYHAGCRDFFVATLDEGLVLREVVGRDARIYILNGLAPDNVELMLRVGLAPVLNGPRDAEVWAGRDWTSSRAGLQPPPAVLQLDTGMSRLGFGQADLDRLLAGDFPIVFPWLSSSAISAAPMIRHR